MMRFVEVWTLRRRGVRVPRVLDADEQEAAFLQWEADDPRRFDARVAVIDESDPQRVVWNTPQWALAMREVGGEARGDVERMMTLARRMA